MVPPTQNQTDRPHTEATYGGLLALAADDAARARASAIGPFQDADLAARTVGDFERYLAVVGHHLELLLAPASVARPRPLAHHQLASALSALRSERHGDNDWTRAGDHLGIAHDLLATHVGPTGELRTSEAVVLGDADVQLAAVARVSALAQGPLAVAPDLLEAAQRIQPSTDPPLSRGTRTHVRQAIARLGRLVTNTPPVAVADASLLIALDALPPARTRVGVGTPRGELGSGLEALRLLRQLLYRQSKGLEPANAHSLQELCELAVTTCTTAEKSLPYAATPLGRVERAAAVDHLRTAATAWRSLSSQLYPHIQGLTKTPAIYHDAIQTLTSEASHGGDVHQAILASLPRLATHAADTTTTLGRRGELVTPTRIPTKLKPAWRPLTSAMTRDLAENFAAAGAASQRAQEASRRSSDGRSHAVHPTADLPRQRQALRTGVAP